MLVSFWLEVLVGQFSWAFPWYFSRLEHCQYRFCSFQGRSPIFFPFPAIINLYLFLEFQRNSSDGTNLDSLHQMSGESSDLVSQSFTRNHCHVTQNLFHLLTILFCSSGNPLTICWNISRSRLSRIFSRFLFWLFP